MATSIFKPNEDTEPQPLLVDIDVAAKMLGMGKTLLRAKVKAGGKIFTKSDCASISSSIS